jgi:RNA polymerase sigma-70 factor (ECF subfamily)
MIRSMMRMQLDEQALCATDMAPPQDSPAIQRSQDRLFNDLVAVHLVDLYRFAYWLSGDPWVADDLVQGASIRAWTSVGRLNDAKAVKGWLLTIVRRENARRFVRRQLQKTDLPLESLACRHSDYATSTEVFVLRCALAQLPQNIASHY